MGKTRRGVIRELHYTVTVQGDEPEVFTNQRKAWNRFRELRDNDKLVSYRIKEGRPDGIQK